MKVLLICASIIGLGLTIVPSTLVYADVITMAWNQHLMLAGMLVWFLTAPYWMKEQGI